MKTGHELSIPGRHESRAMAGACDNGDCFTYSEPVAIYDLPNAGGREAAYRCPACGHRWLCWWAWPIPWQYR